MFLRVLVCFLVLVADSHATAVFLDFPPSCSWIWLIFTRAVCVSQQAVCQRCDASIAKPWIRWRFQAKRLQKKCRQGRRNKATSEVHIANLTSQACLPTTCSKSTLLSKLVTEQVSVRCPCHGWCHNKDYLEKKTVNIGQGGAWIWRNTCANSGFSRSFFSCSLRLFLYLSAFSRAKSGSEISPGNGVEFLRVYLCHLLEFSCLWSVVAMFSICPSSSLAQDLRWEDKFRSRDFHRYQSDGSSTLSRRELLVVPWCGTVLRWSCQVKLTTAQLSHCSVPASEKGRADTVTRWLILSP